MPEEEAPGGGVLLRECALLCFLHLSATFCQCCPSATHTAWVLAPLHEGLKLAVVLFGPKHLLAYRLMSTLRRTQELASRAAPLAARTEAPATGQASAPVGQAHRAAARRPKSAGAEAHRHFVVPKPQEKATQEVRSTNWVGHIGKNGIVDAHRKKTGDISAMIAELNLLKDVCSELPGSDVNECCREAKKAAVMCGIRPCSRPSATRPATAPNLRTEQRARQAFMAHVQEPTSMPTRPAAPQPAARCPRYRGVTRCRRTPSEPPRSSMPQASDCQPKLSHKVKPYCRHPGSFHDWPPVLGSPSNIVAECVLP